MNTDHDQLALELGKTWDEVGRGNQCPSTDDEYASVVHLLTTEYNSTRLSSAAESAIWSTVLAGAVGVVESAEQVQRVPKSEKVGRTDFWGRVLSVAHRIAWILVAGLLGGFIAGVGARLFMRVAGVLTIDRNRFMLTEADARVGELTFAGTMTLGAIGAALGVFALIFYVLIRDRLPFSGWQRSAVYSWILLLVFGYVLMNPGNHDYHTFGPAWLNVVTFSSLYLVMGFTVASIYEAGLRSEREHAWFARNQWLAIVRSVLSVGLCATGVLLLVPALFLGTASFLIPLIALATWITGKLAGPDWIAKLRMPVLVQHWGAWVIPGLVGFILTARGITGILMN